MSSSFRSLVLLGVVCSLVSATSCGSGGRADSEVRASGGTAGAAETAGGAGRAGTSTAGTSTAGTSTDAAGNDDGGGRAGAAGGEDGGTAAGGRRETSADAGEGGRGPERECQPGERRCVGLVPELCDAAEGWRADGAACAYVCRAGACSGGCVPGSTQCASETERQTCADDGEWGTGKPCTNACVQGACGGDCVPGARRCLERTRQQCSTTGTWQDDGAPCPFLCSSGACTGSCTPGETQCVSSTALATCDAGTWSASSECAHACIAGTCGGVCTPGDVECVAGNPSTEHRSCGSDGQWAASTACTYVCTGQGDCSGECVPGALRCDNAQPEQCVAGAWSPKGPACSAGTMCNPKTGACDSCEPFLCGDYRERVAWQVIGPPGQLIDIVVDASDNIYVTGRIDSNSYYLAKYDASGTLVWEKRGAAAGSAWQRLAVGPNGNLWAAGPGGYIGRFAPDGTSLGVATYHNGDDFWGIELDAAGNVYVTGATPPCCDSPTRRPFVAKYSPSLVELWSRTDTIRGMGLTVDVDSAGNVFLVGRADIPQSGTMTSSRLLIQRFDPSGTRTFNSVTGSCPTSGQYIIAHAAAADAAGNLLVSGASCGLPVALTEKWSSAGSRLWKTDVPLSTATGSGAHDVDFRSNGNSVAVTGNAEVYSHSPSGELLWNRKYATSPVNIVASGLLGTGDLITGGYFYVPSGSTRQLLVRLRLPADP